MEEGLENEKVHAGSREQANLLGNEIADVVRRGLPFAFEELSTRNRARHESLIACDLTGDANSSVVDRLRLFAITGAVQLLPRSEECERLQNFGAGVQKLAMEFAKRV